MVAVTRAIKRIDDEARKSKVDWTAKLALQLQVNILSHVLGDEVDLVSGIHKAGVALVNKQPREVFLYTFYHTKVVVKPATAKKLPIWCIHAASVNMLSRVPQITMHPIVNVSGFDPDLVPMARVDPWSLTLLTSIAKHIGKFHEHSHQITVSPKVMFKINRKRHTINFEMEKALAQAIDVFLIDAIERKLGKNDIARAILIATIDAVNTPLGDGRFIPLDGEKEPAENAADIEDEEEDAYDIDDEDDLHSIINQIVQGMTGADQPMVIWHVCFPYSLGHEREDRGTRLRID